MFTLQTSCCNLNSNAAPTPCAGSPVLAFGKQASLPVTYNKWMHGVPAREGDRGREGAGCGDVVQRSAVEMGMARGKKGTLRAVRAWLRLQPLSVKAALGVAAALAALVFLWLAVRDHDNLFVAAEACHAAGVAVLVYKLAKDRTCTGISLKSQELTAIFLSVRLYCSFMMEYNIHTVLDAATLATTLWVIYMIRYQLRSSYTEDKDNFTLYHVTIPCALLALIVHPSTHHYLINRVAWAFCVYLEAVSVLPQLHVMQKTKIVESLTAHYVFALGVARFLSCAHWILQNFDSHGLLWSALGHGPWPYLVILSELVQTFILADFCYYYVKSLIGGDLVLRLPSGAV